ncbi:DUF4154 domain-containing protein [Aliikangiella marina]|uniref:Sensory/regulatory protein RpfC n=1 Tax=Aliikangiella marina TaxID=1712262 RepID=A0A545TEG7_9GAMM|nr:YfiR/HmsC family protein [Aliikangiella marina]TQV75600.1 DUF4154 domain-containing protein [Aliikangiella marina]
MLEFIRLKLKPLGFIKCLLAHLLITIGRHQKLRIFYVLCFMPFAISAQQVVSPEAFKAAFIFHALDKIEWRNENEIRQFKIGIVGSDPKLLAQLQRSVQLKQIDGKTISAEQATNLSSFQNYHLLFVAENSKISLRRIAAATSRTNTLLITENVSDKAFTMINLVFQENGTYRFEINKANITFEYLKMDPDILMKGGTEMDVAELLRDTNAELVALREELKAQADAVENSRKQVQEFQQQYQKAVDEAEEIKLQMQKQARLLEEKNRLIEAKNVSIREREGELLAIQTELSQASESLQSNQTLLGEKLDTIANKEKEVTSLSELIEANEQILERQRVSIDRQKAELDRQKQSLLEQGSQIEKQQSWLMYSSVLLLVFTIFLMVIIYLNKERRKTNVELTEKNKALNEVQSELLVARDQAQAANEAKSSFLANMSHEIRTPMNAIIGMLHLTKQTELNQKQGNYLNKIDTAANSLLQIINDILDFSKVEAGELAMEKVEFSLSKVLDDLANITGPRIQEKGLEFIYDISPDIPQTVIGDPLRLGQILVNLTSNAMKFTDSGEVKVSVNLISQSENDVELFFSVVDSGIGMSPDVSKRLFKPFSQADSSTTRKFGGTGLGLAICKRLVAEMNGDINVSSKPGEGSTFSFNARFGKASSQSLLESISDNHQLDNYCVMVVVKNLVARESIFKILKSFRCKVLLSEDYQSFEKQLESAAEQNKTINNIIFDYSFAFANQQEIKRIKQTSDTKITLLLSNIHPEEDQTITFIQPDITINKPITPSSMLDSLMSLLDNSKIRKPTQRLSRVEQTDKTTHLSAKLLSSNILIVEDNEINQEVAREILSQAVNSIDLANNGKEAVEMVSQKLYDCVLMDVQMPVMDGYEATREIRKLYSSKELPIIAMTANAMGGDKEKCLAAGMNDYVSKPLRIKSFFETLNKWFSDGEQSQLSETPAPSNIQPEQMVTNIDLEGGAELMGDKATFVGLLEQYSLQQGEFSKHAKLLLQAKDFETLAKESHNLKGVSANLFIDGIPELAASLEKACRQENIKQALLTLESLSDALSKVLAEIEALRTEIA